jgi:glutathione S-transferase
MALTLHYHPLASFCWKVLIALYENDTPFETRIVDLGDATSSAAFKALWPIGKMPVLADGARNETVPETSIIIEYLARHYPGRIELLPADPELARQVRLWDRLFDLYVEEPMQTIVGNRIRPGGQKDPYGVAAARRTLATAYGLVETQMAGRSWAMGEAFTMADCAAAPALYYADLVEPLGEAHPNVAAYLARLKERPSFARVLEEAQPYFGLFPREDRD